MWDLIVSVPDHCLSVYFVYFLKQTWPIVFLTYGIKRFLNTHISILIMLLFDNKVCNMFWNKQSQTWIIIDIGKVIHQIIYQEIMLLNILTPFTIQTRWPDFRNVIIPSFFNFHVKTTFSKVWTITLQMTHHLANHSLQMILVQTEWNQVHWSHTNCHWHLGLSETSSQLWSPEVFLILSGCLESKSAYLVVPVMYSIIQL